MSKSIYINFDNIEFLDIIYNNSAFAIIWDVKYKGLPAIAKMITLKSGIHYDKDDKNYYTKGKKKLENHNDYYKIIRPAPFIHMLFINKRSISNEHFLHEVAQFNNLSAINLAPKIYTHGISHTVDGFKYGFIVMEKWDNNVKDYILSRDGKISSSEKKLVQDTIDRLHSENYYHGDLKPNNIGVKISNGKIHKCCFFDCYTVLKMTEDTRDDYIKRDLHKYKHYLGLINK